MPYDRLQTNFSDTIAMKVDRSFVVTGIDQEPHAHSINRENEEW